MTFSTGRSLSQRSTIEVGLLIHTSTLAERIVRHFEALLAEGVLKPVWGSRDNCLDMSG